MASDVNSSRSQTPNNTVAEGPSVYHVKWVSWPDSESKTPIITQNKNGPCPLLALFNVLLLSRKISLPEQSELITSEQIMEHLGNLMFEQMSPDLSESDKANYEQNMSDAITIFPKLQTGIDVNVQFKSTTSFECTPELVVFDLLRIQLYHGWLPDPQDPAMFSAVNNKSYNQVVDHIIASKESSDDQKVTEGIAAEQFLNSNAAQLTCHGVVSVLETMKDGELAVLFRNNHFSTITRKKSELFTLVTDQGFLTKDNIVWETLSNIQGDSQFTNSLFLNTPRENHLDEAAIEPNLSPEEQIDQDLMLALSLSTEQPSENQSGSVASPSGQITEKTDREIAARLQQQYDREVAHASRQQSRPTESKEKCVIL